MLFEILGQFDLTENSTRDKSSIHLQILQPLHLVYAHTGLRIVLEGIVWARIQTAPCPEVSILRRSVASKPAFLRLVENFR